MKVADSCRQHGIPDATCYNWKSKDGGMEASDLERMKELEAGVWQYKRMYAAPEHRKYDGFFSMTYSEYRGSGGQMIGEYILRENNNGDTKLPPGLQVALGVATLKQMPMLRNDNGDKGYCSCYYYGHFTTLCLSVISAAGTRSSTRVNTRIRNVLHTPAPG